MLSINGDYVCWVRLPCPDYVTVRKCLGKIEVKILSFRIARGRGRFIIAVDEGVEYKCSRCRRKFKVQNPTESVPNILFTPI